jgi:DNA-binding NarL/FixJ family response regulator
VRTILVVEDAEIVASGMRATLEQDEANVVVAIVASVAEAARIVRSQHVDVLVADIRLADGTAFDLLRLLAEENIQRPTLIVSSFELAQYVDAALRLGASGYILKTAPGRELLAAIETVSGGGWAFDPALVSSANRAKQLGLTARDRQVIERLVAGRSNDEIGSDLGISRKTVEAHVSKLLSRFEVSSRVELVRLAERDQWLASPVSDRAPSSSSDDTP